MLRLPFLLLLLGLLWAPIAAQAQVYEPGLLVRANGDTLRGEIENGFWDMPPTFIRFRPVGGASVLFQPRQLRAVRFDKGRYFRYEALPIDHAAETRLDMLPTGLMHDVHLDSLLAEVLLEGPTMLWRVAQLGGLHLLVQRPGQPVLELCERRYLREGPRSTQVLTDANNYRSQLQVYFGDCPAAVVAADSAAFTPAGLGRVVRAYYASCTPGQPLPHSWLQPATRRRKTGFQAGILAGARYNHIDNQASAPTNQCTDCAVHPFAGLYAELLLASRTVAVYGELSLSSFKSQNSVYRPYGGSYPVSYRAQLATARLGLRFFAPLAHDQHLLFTFGVEHNEVFGATPLASTLAPDRDEMPFAKTTLLPNFGVGWRRQRLTAHLDGQLYTSRDAEGKESIFLGSNVAVRLGLSYRLGRSADAHATSRP